MPTSARDIASTPQIRTPPLLHNGHLQTIARQLSPPRRPPPASPKPELVEVSPATDNQIASQVLCHCHWQPAEVRATRPTAIIVHGLEGSSNSQYVVGNSNKLWRAGCNIIRMNMRNCGGTEGLTPTLYHSGLSGDVLAVLRLFVERMTSNPSPSSAIPWAATSSSSSPATSARRATATPLRHRRLSGR